MPRKQTARDVRDSSDSDNPTNIFINAQQKMATLRRSHNRRRKTIASKHADEFARIKERIETRLKADQKRILEAQKDALARWVEAVSATLRVEDKIQERVGALHKECADFVESLRVVYEGRKGEVLDMDLKGLLQAGSVEDH